MALNQVDISMMQDIPAPGPEGKIIISDGTDWTSGENTPVGSIVKQATDPTPTDPATPTLGDMILNTGNGKLFNCTDATAGAAVWIDALPAAGADGQVLTSDGTNWASEAAAGGGGGAWELIGTASPTDEASVEFGSSVVSTTYIQIKFVFDHFVCAAAESFAMYGSTDGGTTWEAGAGDNKYTVSYIYTPNASWNVWSNDGESIGYLTRNSAIGSRMSGEVYVMHHGQATWAHAGGTFQTVDNSSNVLNSHVSAVVFTHNNINAIKFAYTNGNITSGECRVYGLSYSGGPAI